MGVLNIKELQRISNNYMYNGMNHIYKKDTKKEEENINNNFKEILQIEEEKIEELER